jgi:hypothetical protein
MIARRIARAAEEGALSGLETQTVSSFLRGLTAGALIGAAIAGSALLQRRRASRAHGRVHEGDDGESTAGREPTRPQSLAND